jgi:hypothetical protein
MESELYKGILKIIQVMYWKWWEPVNKCPFQWKTLKSLV